MDRREFVATGTGALASAALPTRTARVPTHVALYRYLADASRLTSDERVEGAARVLELKGRKGIHATSIHATIQLSGGHTLNESSGTVILWFFALEDLAASFQAEHMKIDDPFFASYPFLSDFAVPRNVADANFSLEWNRANELRAKMFRGTVYPSLLGFEPPQKAWVQAVPFNYFRQHRWYQLSLTWDTTLKSASLFVNGVLIGKSDRFNAEFHRDRCGNTLYAGCPALCQGEIAFYDRALSGAELYGAYRAAAQDYDAAEEQLLRHTFEGERLKDFTFSPNAAWTKALDIDFLSAAQQMEHFYIQGDMGSVKPGESKEGLLIETPSLRYGTREAFSRQVYLWSNRTFEGNIYVELEWKALRPNGLSLLMIHASGMTREDFMADYPKKTSGAMQTVYEENVRNYHWEFFREMNDVRNDTATSFSRKNPFAFRNSFCSAPGLFEKKVWHKLQLVQNGGHIVGAIDGKVLLDFSDESRTNTGCVLNYGHIALRCMVHTAMLYRNLKVYTERLPFVELMQSA